MINIAHRGFSSQFPENTLLAFQEALDLGVNHVELDLQVTHDGHLVVLHDRSVDRTTDGSGPVDELTLDEIRQLDAGSWFAPRYSGLQIPTYEELLTELDPSATLVTELKFEGNEAIDLVVDTIRDHDAADRVVISSFDLEKLPVVRAAAPDLPLTALLRPDQRTPAQWVEWALEVKVDTLGPKCVDVTEDYVRIAHDAGLRVRAWGLGQDQGEEMSRLIDAGVDGMTTDCPDILQRLLAERGV